MKNENEKYKYGQQSSRKGYIFIYQENYTDIEVQK